MRTTFCEYQGMTISASVCIGIGDTAHGLVAVTSDEGRRQRGYYLLQWDEILWAKRNSYKTYDLNGINPALNPQVYRFKSGLKGNEVTFLGCTIVIRIGQRSGLSIWAIWPCSTSTREM